MLSSQARRSRNLGIAFFAPAGIVIFLGFLFPLIRVISLAFTTPGGFGLENIAAVFSDKTLLTSLGNTLIFVVVSTLAHIVLGFVLASFLNFDLSPGFVKTARSAMIIPWAISPVVVATIFRLLYHPELSVFSSLFQKIPFLAQGILTNEHLALWAIIAINIWYATPFYFLLFLARMQSIPREVHEASIIDGASYFTYMRRISFPILKPLVVTLAVYDVVAAFNTFDIIWLTTQGGPGSSTETLATYIYRVAFRGGLDFEYASALGLVLLVCIMAVCGLIWVLGNREWRRRKDGH